MDYALTGSRRPGRREFPDTAGRNTLQPVDEHPESVLHLPLSVAAASALCRLPGAENDVSSEEYHTALNLAAAALSRVIPIYTVEGQSRPLVRAEIDLGSGRFRDGATLYEHANGTRVRPLLVARDGVAAAIEIVRNAGLPFEFVCGRV